MANLILQLFKKQTNKTTLQICFRLLSAIIRPRAELPSLHKTQVLQFRTLVTEWKGPGILISASAQSQRYQTISRTSEESWWIMECLYVRSSGGNHIKRAAVWSSDGEERRKVHPNPSHSMILCMNRGRKSACKGCQPTCRVIHGKQTNFCCFLFHIHGYIHIQMKVTTSSAPPFLESPVTP